MQFGMAQIQGAGVPAPTVAYPSLPAEQRQKVVKTFLGRLGLIDAFIATNPARLSEEELGIVSSCRHLGFPDGGAEGVRTPDLLNAIQEIGACQPCEIEIGNAGGGKCRAGLCPCGPLVSIASVCLAWLL